MGIPQAASPELSRAVDNMSGSPVATADNTTPRPKTARRRGRGRGGRGSVRSTLTAPNTQREAQETPQVPASEASSLNVQPNESLRAARGSRGGKRGGRGGGASQDNGRRRGRGRGEDSKAVSGGLGGRTFEGRLSKPERASDEDQPDDTGDLSLRADAPEFVPGAPTDGLVPNGITSTADSTTGKGKSKHVQPRPPKVTTKSTAPDIATRIHEDIAHNLYECPICTSELGRRSRVWSCGLCWTVFHLSCVKKWSKNEGSAAQDAARRQAEGEPSSPRAWRCPGCNLPHEIFPSTYSCWCEKEVDPRPLPGLPPHSCGQTCSRPRKGCPHPCDATCHAGPCSPCTAMGPTQDCFCGRNSSTKRCQDTDYENGWSCGECSEKTPCASTVTVTCGCGRLRQSRRCNAAAASKGPVPQPTRGPSLTPLTCDDECARLERNRALASALGVEINPTTTVASSISPNTLPYSTETLDLYVQLSSTSPLSTLQTYESTLHSLATSTTQRSVRFQPAKSPLRAFIHSLAADWGFASESFDPEPHRHVFVLKPTTWTPPLLGFGPENSIGIGGKSVGECVKLRERQRLKEREAQRLAAAEAKALKEAARAQQSTDTTSDGGWAQVAASRRSNGVSSTRSTTPVASPSPWSGSKFAALAGGDSGGWGLPKKEKLVLRSGVGAAKKNLSTLPATEVADNWEEEEEKVEQEEERERERERDQQSEGEEELKVEENNELTDPTDSGLPAKVEMPADAVVSTD
ncbi:hypothetical protein ALT_3039 [Aspergillus lentulus]|uniref:R3H domain-containing protein n=1 Tax=Aspergillus lentulus TaxID=293939 RepID=A0AAN4PGG2_ASPLE|nr:hypothetical protein ALT_3039 [Aspergillus lentulus]